MAIQLIFCVETNKRSDSDWIYIKETIDNYYIVNNQVKLNKVYMNTKTKYKSKDVLKEIDKKIKDFKIGESIVIYCIDTDEFEKNNDHVKEFNNVLEFCKTKGYEMVWFCHDIEEVYLGKSVPDSQKVKMAADFRRKNLIKGIEEKILNSNQQLSGKSNILNVLRKYLTAKS